MNTLKQWYEEYERWLIPGALVVGFIVDAITFQSINLKLAFIILGVHLIVSLSIITFMHFYDEGFITSKSKMIQNIRLFSPVLLQYTFGALLSAFLIFYGFNGVLSTSWPFIVIIIFLMISNDLLKRYYLHTAIQISVYYFILFSFLALVLPFILKSMSAWIFVLSGIGSFFLIRFYIRGMSSFIETVRHNTERITWAISIIFLAMNIFYFTNTIPPIPLSLKESGVYHYVERGITAEDYNFSDENSSWLNHLRTYPRISYNKSIYIYSSVFAPITLDTDIIHHWQFYNEEEKDWVTIEKIKFPISGGRDGGYRGYSKKDSIQPGYWAVDIETERGQDVGRVRFKLLEN